MFRALGARLTLDHKGVAGVALFEAAAQRMWIWANDGLKTANEYAPSSDGLRRQRVCSWKASFTRMVEQLPRCDATPITDRCIASPCNGRMNGIRRLLWLTTGDAVRTGDGVDVGVSVEQDMRHLRVPPSPLAPPLVALLHDFVEAAHTPGRSVSAPPLKRSSEASRSTRSSTSCLLDPGRRLPVVLFSAMKEEDGVYPPDAGNPALTARELCGLAHVYVMPRVEDSHRLTKRLRDALGLRRCCARLLAAFPAQRPSPAPSSAPPSAPQHLKRACHHPARG